MHQLAAEGLTTQGHTIMLSGECCASHTSIINHGSSCPHRGGWSVHEEDG
jgi:hypothetical protein